MIRLATIALIFAGIAAPALAAGPTPKIITDACSTGLLRDGTAIPAGWKHPGGWCDQTAQVAGGGASYGGNGYVPPTAPAAPVEDDPCELPELATL